MPTNYVGSQGMGCSLETIVLSKISTCTELYYPLLSSSTGNRAVSCLFNFRGSSRMDPTAIL